MAIYNNFKKKNIVYDAQGNPIDISKSNGNLYSNNNLVGSELERISNVSTQNSLNNLNLPIDENGVVESMQFQKPIATKGIYSNKLQLPKSEYVAPAMPLTEGQSILQDLNMNKLGLDNLNINSVIPDTKPVSTSTTATVTPVVPTKSLSTIGAANIATGISTAANVASSIYGAIQASKMKPTLSSYQAPIEPVLISDNTNAIQSAGKENIDKSINTARASNQRNGLVGMDGVLLSKENEGLNQLSASLAQYRQGIDSANAQIQNQTNQYNQSNESNRNQFNAQTQNQFDQYKSGLIGMAMKNATDNLSAGVGSIFKNLSQSSQIQLMSVESEIESLLNEPNGSVLNAPRIETLQKESKAIRESIYGNKIYNT